MRPRLILSFILIVIVSIVSVALIARLQIVTAVDSFVRRGGFAGIESLVNNLEEYYSTNGTWDGVESSFRHPGRGLGQGQGPGRRVDRIKRHSGDAAVRYGVVIDAVPDVHGSRDDAERRRGRRHDVGIGCNARLLRS